MCRASLIFLHWVQRHRATELTENGRTDRQPEYIIPLVASPASGTNILILVKYSTSITWFGGCNCSRVSLVLSVMCFVDKIDTKSKDEDDVNSAVSTTAADARGYSCDADAAVSTSGVIQEAEKCKGWSGEVCTGHGKQDDLIVFTATVFAQLYARWHLCWLQHQELTRLWIVQLQAKVDHIWSRLHVLPG